jgi:hypothetical protein
MPRVLRYPYPGAVYHLMARGDGGKRVCETDAAGNTAGGSAINQYARINDPGSSTLQSVYDDDGNLPSGPIPGASGLLPGVPVPANAALTCSTARDAGHGGRRYPQHL